MAGWLTSCASGDGATDAGPVQDGPPPADAWVAVDAVQPIDAARPPPDAAPGTSTVLRLDGDGDGVELPRNPEYGAVGTRFTIELWFLPESANVNDFSMLYTRRAHYGDYSLTYSRGDDGLVGFDVWGDGGTMSDLVSLRSRTAPSVGVWHHVAGVVDGRAIRLYLDGVLEAEATSPGDITWRPDDPRALLHDEYRTFVGYTRSPDDAGARFVGRFRGDVDDVRVSRVPRYAGPSFVPPATMRPDADTVGLWTFEEPDGPTAEDSSPSGALDGTIVGAVRVPGGR
jgi:hypothetical protein